MGSEVAYCDCGTCGPLGAGAGAGAVFPPTPFLSRSRTPPPPPPLNGGATGGAPGVSWAGAPPLRMIDAGLRSNPAIHDNNRLVTKKPAARNAVVRVKTFAVPRPVMKPEVELTSPPPSDFCNSTTPIRPSTSMRWMTIMTLSIDDFPPAARASYRQPRRSLHDPARHFYGRNGPGQTAISRLRCVCTRKLCVLVWFCAAGQIRGWPKRPRESKQPKPMTDSIGDIPKAPEAAGPHAPLGKLGNDLLLHLFGDEGLASLRAGNWKFILVIAPVFGFIADVCTVFGRSAPTLLVVCAIIGGGLALPIVFRTKYCQHCAIPCVFAFILVIAFGFVAATQRVFAAEDTGVSAKFIPGIPEIQNMLAESLG